MECLLQPCLSATARTLLTIVPPALERTCEDGQLSFADLA